MHLIRFTYLPDAPLERVYRVAEKLDLLFLNMSITASVHMSFSAQPFNLMKMIYLCVHLF